MIKMTVVRSLTFCGTLLIVIFLISFSTQWKSALGQDEEQFEGIISPTPTVTVTTSVSSSSDELEDLQPELREDEDDNQVGDHNLSEAWIDDDHEACPCVTRTDCPRVYGSDPMDFTTLGQLPPCRQSGYVRCCGVSVSVTQKTDESEEVEADSSDESSTWESETTESESEDASATDEADTKGDNSSVESEGQEGKQDDSESPQENRPENEEETGDTETSESRVSVQTVVAPPPAPEETSVPTPRKRFQATRKFNPNGGRPAADSPSVSASVYTLSSSDSSADGNADANSNYKRKPFTPRVSKFQNPSMYSTSTSTVIPVDESEGGGSLVYSQRVSPILSNRPRAKFNRNGNNNKQTVDTSAPIVSQPAPEINTEPTPAAPSLLTNEDGIAFTSPAPVDVAQPVRKRRPSNKLRNRLGQQQTVEPTEIVPAQESEPIAETVAEPPKPSIEENAPPTVHISIQQPTDGLTTPLIPTDVPSPVAPLQQQPEEQNLKRRPLKSRNHGGHGRRRKQEKAGDGSSSTPSIPSDAVISAAPEAGRPGEPVDPIKVEVDPIQQLEKLVEKDIEVVEPIVTPGSEALANSPTGKLMPLRPKIRPFNRMKAQQGWSATSKETAQNSGLAGESTAENLQEVSLPDVSANPEPVVINNAPVNMKRIPMRRLKQTTTAPVQLPDTSAGENGSDSVDEINVPDVAVAPETVSTNSAPVNIRRIPMRRVQQTAPTPVAVAAPLDGETGIPELDEPAVLPVLPPAPVQQDIANNISPINIRRVPLRRLQPTTPAPAQPEELLEDESLGVPELDEPAVLPVLSPAPVEQEIANNISPINIRRVPLRRLQQTTPAPAQPEEILEDESLGQPGASGTDEADVLVETAPVATPTPIRSRIIMRRPANLPGRIAGIGSTTDGEPGKPGGLEEEPNQTKIDIPATPEEQPIGVSNDQQVEKLDIRAKLRARPRPNILKSSSYTTAAPATVDNVSSDNTEAALEIPAVANSQEPSRSPLLRKRVRPAALRKGQGQATAEEKPESETNPEKEVTDERPLNRINKVRKGSASTLARLPLIRNHHENVNKLSQTASAEEPKEDDKASEIANKASSILIRNRQNRLNAKRGNVRHQGNSSSANADLDVAATSETPVEVTSTYSRIRTNTGKNSMLTRPIFRRPAYVSSTTTAAPEIVDEVPGSVPIKTVGTRFGQRTRFSIPSKTDSTTTEATTTTTVAYTENGSDGESESNIPSSSNDDTAANSESSGESGEDYAPSAGRKRVGFVRRKMVRVRPTPPAETVIPETVEQAAGSPGDASSAQDTELTTSINFSSTSVGEGTISTPAVGAEGQDGTNDEGLNALNTVSEEKLSEEPDKGYDSGSDTGNYEVDVGTHPVEQAFSENSNPPTVPVIDVANTEAYDLILNQDVRKTLASQQLQQQNVHSSTDSEQPEQASTTSTEPEAVFSNNGNTEQNYESQHPAEPEKPLSYDNDASQKYESGSAPTPTASYGAMDTEDYDHTNPEAEGDAGSQYYWDEEESRIHLKFANSTSPVSPQSPETQVPQTSYNNNENSSQTPSEGTAGPAVGGVAAENTVQERNNLMRMKLRRPQSAYLNANSGESSQVAPTSAPFTPSMRSPRPTYSGQEALRETVHQSAAAIKSAETGVNPNPQQLEQFIEQHVVPSTASPRAKTRSRVRVKIPTLKTTTTPAPVPSVHDDESEYGGNNFNVVSTPAGLDNEASSYPTNKFSFPPFRKSELSLITSTEATVAVDVEPSAYQSPQKVALKPLPTPVPATYSVPAVPYQTTTTTTTTTTPAPVIPLKTYDDKINNNYGPSSYVAPSAAHSNPTLNQGKTRFRVNTLNNQPNLQNRRPSNEPVRPTLSSPSAPAPSSYSTPSNPTLNTVPATRKPQSRIRAPYSSRIPLPLPTASTTTTTTTTTTQAPVVIQQADVSRPLPSVYAQDSQYQKKQPIQLVSPVEQPTESEFSEYDDQNVVSIKITSDNQYTTPIQEQIVPQQPQQTFVAEKPHSPQVSYSPPRAQPSHVKPNGKKNANSRFRVPGKFDLQKPNVLPSSNDNVDNEVAWKAYKKPEPPVQQANVPNVRPQQQISYQSKPEQPAGKGQYGNQDVIYNEPVRTHQYPQQPQLVSNQVVVQARPEPEEFDEVEEQEVIPDIRINVVPPQQQQQPSNTPTVQANNRPQTEQQQYKRPEPQAQQETVGNRFAPPTLVSTRFGAFPSTDHWSGIPSENSPRLPEQLAEQSKPQSNLPPVTSYKVENEEQAFRRPSPVPQFEQQRPVHWEQRPATVEQRPLSYDQRPAPLEQRPLSYDQRPAPVEQRPLPYDQRPLPVDHRPMPYEQRPLPVEQRPLSFGQRPLPVEQRPLPYEHRPVPMEQRPLPYDQRPFPVEKRPFDQRPLPMEQRPQHYEQNSVHIEERPVSIEHRPASFEQRQPPVEQDRPLQVDQRPLTGFPPRPINAPVRFEEIREENNKAHFAPTAPLLQPVGIKFGTDFQAIPEKEEEIRVQHQQRPAAMDHYINGPMPPQGFIIRSQPQVPPTDFQSPPLPGNNINVDVRPTGENQEVQIVGNRIPPVNIVNEQFSPQQIVNIHHQPPQEQAPVDISVIAPIQQTNPISIEIKDGEVINPSFPHPLGNDMHGNFPLQSRPPQQQQIHQQGPSQGPQFPHQQIIIQENSPPQSQQEQIIFQGNVPLPSPQQPIVLKQGNLPPQPNHQQFQGQKPPHPTQTFIIENKPEVAGEPIRQQQPVPQLQGNLHFAPERNPNFIVQIDGRPHDEPISQVNMIQTQLSPMERPATNNNAHTPENGPENHQVFHHQFPQVQQNVLSNLPTDGPHPVRDQPQIRPQADLPLRQTEIIGVRFPEATFPGFGENNQATRTGQFGPPPPSQQRLPQYVPFGLQQGADPNANRNESSPDLLRNRPPVLPPPPQTYQNPFKFNTIPTPPQANPAFTHNQPITQNYNFGNSGPHNQQYNPHNRPQQSQMPMMRLPQGQYLGNNPHYPLPNQPRLRNPGVIRTSRAANLSALEESVDAELLSPISEDSHNEETSSSQIASQSAPLVEVSEMSPEASVKVAAPGQHRQQRELNLGESSEKISLRKTINSENFVQDTIPGDDDSYEQTSDESLETDAAVATPETANLYDTISSSEQQEGEREDDSNETENTSEYQEDNLLSSPSLRKSGKNRKSSEDQVGNHKAKLEQTEKSMEEKSAMKLKSASVKDKRLEIQQTKGSNNKKDHGEIMDETEEQNDNAVVAVESSSDIQQDFVAPTVTQRGFHPILPYSEQDPGLTPVQMEPAVKKGDKFVPPFALAGASTMDPSINRVESGGNNNNAQVLPILLPPPQLGHMPIAAGAPPMMMMGPGKMTQDPMQFHHVMNKHLASGGIPVVMMQPNGLNIGNNPAGIGPGFRNLPTNNMIV